MDADERDPDLVREAYEQRRARATARRHTNMDPYYISPEEEARLQQEADDQRDNLRAAIAATISDERGNLYLSEIYEIALGVLGEAPRSAGEPEWQVTKIRKALKGATKL